jgi:CubicO group peptidase (beta-lactamase class C family)
VPSAILAALALALPTIALGCASAQRSPMPAAPASLEQVMADSVTSVLTHALVDRAFPGAYAVMGSHDRIYAGTGVGRLDWVTPSPRPDEHTLWDLASLTKVIGMTTAMMQLVAAGKVDLDAPVQRYLPDFTGLNKDRVTVRHLLTHSSGLPAWRPLYKEATSPAQALAIVLQTPLDTVPGARMVYSDLGAILLGHILERVTNEPLDDYLTGHVFRPLGMNETMYRPDSMLLARVAPTEYDPWRQRKVHGEVHDENAYALGGVSAHAGLFSSGHDLTLFAQSLLRTYRGEPGIVSTSTLRYFTTVQDSAFSNRALGWEVPNGRNSAGHYLSRHAFGHTGFTGTSIWIDPDRDLFIVLLTNRVNPTRENRRIASVRVALADAVASALDTARPAPSPVPAPARP